MSPLSIRAEISTGLILCKCHASNHSSCKFISTMVMSYPTALLPILQLYIHHSPLQGSLGHVRGGDGTAVPLRAKHSQSFSLSTWPAVNLSVGHWPLQR